MKTADLGFEKELIFRINSRGMGKDKLKRQVFKEKMLKNPNIKKVAFGQLPGNKGAGGGGIVEYNGIKIHPIRNYYFSGCENKSKKALSGYLYREYV